MSSYKYKTECKRRGEIVNLPSGSQIIPHDLSKKAVGKSNINLGGIHITVQGNMIGNEKYANYLGNFITGRLKVTLANI